MHQPIRRTKPIVYRITMATPIGARHGKLRLQREEGQLCGTLELLSHIEPVTGWVDAQGQCTLRGQLVTLMQTIPYTATGHITDAAVELSLRGDRHVFPITGDALAESEEQP